MRLTNLAAACAVFALGITPAIAADLALTGATIVHVETGSTSPGQTLLITDGRIEAILPDGDTPEASRVVAVDGQFVIPGFLDMHAHPLNVPEPAGIHQLMLAHGITGYRQMSGTDALLQARAAGQNLAPQPAPELLALPGEILTGANTRTPEDAARNIAHQKDLGADMIKIVDMAPQVWQDSVRQARAAGLPIAGHMPPTVSSEDAARAGISALEHFGAGDGMMLDCSADEEAIRGALLATPPAPADAHGHDEAQSHPISSANFLVNPVAYASAETLDRFRRVEETFDAEKCAALAQVLVKNGTWMVPTLIRLRTQDLGNAPEYVEDPDLAYVPAQEKATWNEVAGAFSALPRQDQDMLVRFFGRYIEMTGIFAKAGVPMLTGSDFGGGWLVPGFSLHAEFDLLGQAGLTPLQVLQSATINGAKFLDRTDNMGTVATGKVADLVLLSEDPTADVSALHAITAVVRAGTYYNQEDLERMIEAHRQE